MEFTTEAHKSVYDKVAGLMKELFGEFATPREEFPQFDIRAGSAYIFVSVSPWGDDDATITARSYLVSGAELTLELMDFLLRASATMRFGGFGIDDDGDIIFEYTIVGSTCDKEQLRASTRAVMNVADEYDDKIVASYGGTRSADRS